MTDIRWSTRARRDYRDTVEWLEERNPAAAMRVSREVLNKVSQLASMPWLGRVGRVKGTRELVITGTPYVVIYRVENDGALIGIARVLHGARKWPPG